MSRDRFQRLDLTEGSNVIEIPEQQVVGRVPEASLSERVRGLLRGIAEGATGGWIDEAAGGLIAALPESTRMGIARLMAPEGQEDAYMRAAADVGYRETRDAARAQQDEAAQRAPGQFIAGSLAGGVATGRLLPQAGAGLSGGSQTVARIAQAAGEGVLAGAGGSRAEDVGGIATDAAVGGAMGGGIAGGLAGVGVTGRALRSAQRGLEAVDQDVGRAADLVTDLERVGSVIEDDRIRLKPATIRAIFAEHPPDPRALEATRGWFDDLAARIDDLMLDQGATLPQGRQALRNLRNVINDQRVRFESALSAGDPAEAFLAADQAKRSLGSAQGAAGRGLNADRYTARVFQGWADEARGLLENDAWGGGAAFQRAQNPAWTEYLSRRRPYERFLEESPERLPSGWGQMDRASRPAVASTIRGAGDVTQADYVRDLVEGARTRATMTQRLAAHEGSRLTPELTQRAQDAADEIAAIATRAQNPGLGRRIGAEIADSTLGRRVAAVGDVVGEPLEAVGETLGAGAARGAPRAAVTATTSVSMPRATTPEAEVSDDEYEQMVGEAGDVSDDEYEQMLGD